MDYPKLHINLYLTEINKFKSELSKLQRKHITKLSKPTSNLCDNIALKAALKDIEKTTKQTHTDLINIMWNRENDKNKDGGK